MNISKRSLVAAAVVGGLLVGIPLGMAQDTTNAAPKAAEATNPTDAATPARPQRPAGGFIVNQRVERLNREVKLTEEQKPKVKAVYEEQMKKLRELRTERSEKGVTPELRAKQKALQDEEAKALKEILTPEQFEKYQKLSRPGQRPAATPAAQPKTDGKAPATEQPKAE